MAEAEIYLYKEYDEDDSYGCESIKAYLSQKDAVNYLTERIKACYDVKDLNDFVRQYGSRVDTENYPDTFAIWSEPYKSAENFIVDKLNILGHDGEPLDALDIYCLTEAKQKLLKWGNKPDDVVINDDLIERVAASIKYKLMKYNIDEAVAQGADEVFDEIIAEHSDKEDDYDFGCLTRLAELARKGCGKEFKVEYNPSYDDCEAYSLSVDGIDWDTDASADEIDGSIRSIYFGATGKVLPEVVL